MPRWSAAGLLGRAGLRVAGYGSRGVDRGDAANAEVKTMRVYDGFWTDILHFFAGALGTLLGVSVWLRILGV